MVTNNSLNNSSSPFDVDNLHLEDNTISSTDTNGPVIIDPNGTGDFQVTTGDVDVQAGAAVIDPGAATDSYLQYNESTTGKWRTGNDATDDSYRISQGSALGTNDTLILSSTGQRTRPLQSTFVVTNGGVVNNVTGDGTLYTIIYDTASKNIGSDFNTGTGVYVAPVDGIYSFTGYLVIEGLLSGHTTGYYYCQHGSGQTFGLVANYAALRTVNVGIWAPFTTICQLSASDTVSVKVFVSGSTKVVDVFSRFSGGLLQ